jgi:hypothetical protein
MARLNAEYGSELHLLRMLGRHRGWFNRKVCGATGADQVEWCDFPSGAMRQDNQGRIFWDREWERLEFLPAEDPGRKAWEAAWPRQGTGHNWDAIGRLHYGAVQEWLLVEAKGNLEELKSDCAAKGPASIDLIRGTLDRTKAALGAAEACDWMHGYYQYCNRLAALHAMNHADTPARLLLLYLCGDIDRIGTRCPRSEGDWMSELAKQERHVGLSDVHPLADRVHRLFLNVQCCG